MIFSLPAILLIMAFTVIPEELKIGSPIPFPDVKLKDITGKQISFNDAKMKNGLLVVFSCNTCPWVIRNQKVAAEAYNYALSKNIGVVILNSNEGERSGNDSKERMKEYAKQQNYQWPYLIDEDAIMADAFAAKVTPECYLFNQEMKLVYHGAITDNPKSPSESSREHLKVAIDEVAEGKEVSIVTSKAMGCTIKRKS